MIVLDTNVLSEIMRLRPQPSVLAWLDAQEPEELWLTAVVAAELMYGIARLSDGRRKQRMVKTVSAMLEQDFAGRVLPFDLAAASVYAELVAQRERIGMCIAMADAQMAAICLVHEAPLVTRNQKHFEGLGLMIIDPWESASLVR